MVVTIQCPKETKAKKEHKCDFCLGIIEKGTTYLKSVYVYDSIYSWKTHEKCSKIADELKMYDECDEGVTTEDFHEFINDRYKVIMSETKNEIYESDLFVFPSFIKQLDFVINYHSLHNS